MTALTGDALRAALRKQAEITLVARDEDDAPEGHFSEPADARWVRDQIQAGNEWAWFCAEVRATYAGYVGRDTLGGCSYLSEADFRRPGGYYDDMVTAAIDDLATTIESMRDKATAALAALAEVQS